MDAVVPLRGKLLDYNPGSPPVHGATLAGILRALADEIELGRSAWTALSLTHLQPITRPETGDAIVDYKDLGQSLLITTMPVSSESKKQVQVAIESSVARN